MEFEYLGGAAALDFVNTVSWNLTGLTEERFLEFSDVVAWARGAGLDAQGKPSQRELRRALRVREVLHRVLAPRPVPADLLEFNKLLARAARGLTLTHRLSWQLPSVVDRVIWDAAQLLASEDRKLIRSCANHDCGWLFIDRSRRSNRRWCSMDECGSRAKMRRYYRRKRRAGSGERIK